MSGRAEAILAVLSCPALVALCFLWVDRPAAILTRADLAAGKPVFDALTHLADPVPPLATLGVTAFGTARLFGRRLGPVGRTLAACCLAALVAIALKDELKYAFGRLWPETRVDDNPSLIRDGAYGFVPFHGGRGRFSFPSGHTTMITAPVAVLWIGLPRWRLILAIPVILVVVGLYGADYHFVGDIVAGLYLGAACGIGASALLAGRLGTPSAPAPFARVSTGERSP